MMLSELSTPLKPKGVGSRTQLPPAPESQPPPPLLDLIGNACAASAWFASCFPCVSVADIGFGDQYAVDTTMSREASANVVHKKDTGVAAVSPPPLEEEGFEVCGSLPVPVPATAAVAPAGQERVDDRESCVRGHLGLSGIKQLRIAIPLPTPDAILAQRGGSPAGVNGAAERVEQLSLAKQRQRHRQQVAKQRNGGGVNGTAARMKLLVLVRILLQYLDRVDEPLARLVRVVLKDCERKQLENDSKYPTLADAIRCRLRDAVGEVHWAHARRIQRQIYVNQHRRKALASLKRGARKRGATFKGYRRVLPR